MSVRVKIDYRDGWHSLYQPTGNFRDGMTDAEKEAWIRDYTFEISDEAWQEYCAFAKQSAWWNNYLMHLDAKLYERREAQKTE